MRAQRPSRSRAAGIVAPLAALFAVTLLCGTTTEEAQLFAKRRLRIAGMTHAEIEQLKNNYEEFQKLSPERREALKELDDEVKQDSTGHLLKLLTGYNRWLSNLSPFDQEKVLSKTDPFERAQLIKAMRDEQQRRQALAAVDGFMRQATLQPADLDAIVKAVEENFLSPESRKKIPDQSSGRDRHLRILRLALQQLHSSSNAVPEGQTLVATLIEAIPNESVKNRILNRPAGRPRRQMLGQVLGRSLAVEWQKEIEKSFPTPEAIDTEVAKRLKMAKPDKREQQQLQMSTKQGRRMVGVQMLLVTDDQFKELRPVFFWLVGGLPAKVVVRQQQVAPPDEPRTDEAENKTKSAE
jgi:hypothetical protein